MNYRRIALGLAVAFAFSAVSTADAGWGGSYGSNGSNGSRGSFGGMFSRASHGSHGSFGGLFSRGSHGSFGSHGSHGGSHAACCDCGCEGGEAPADDAGCGCGGDVRAEHAEPMDAPEEAGDEEGKSAWNIR